MSNGIIALTDRAHWQRQVITIIHDFGIFYFSANSSYISDITKITTNISDISAKLSNMSKVPVFSKKSKQATLRNFH